MKVLCLLVLALPLMAAEQETTEWYDADGKVVLVEEAGAAPVETPFVAEWRQREIERREGYGNPWSSEIWPVWGGRYSNHRRYLSRGYAGHRGYYSGIRTRGRHYGGYYRSCPTARRGGATVIIRW